LNTGKRGVSVEYTLPGNDEFAALVASAQIILTTLMPDEFDALELNIPKTQAIAIVHVTPWGATGPYRDRPATSLIVQAAAGWVTSRKEVVMEPVQVGGQMHEWATGSYISVSALTAYRAAKQRQAPVTVDFSEFEATHSMLCYDRLRYDARGELGVPRDRILISPFGIRRCADGWVGINTLTQAQWEDACRMTGLEDYYGFMQEMNRGEGPLEEFSVKVDAFLADKTVNELVTLGQSMRVPTIPVTQGKEMFELAQWQERPFFYEVVGNQFTYKVPGPPWRLSGTPARQSTSAGQR
jgi:crotonobetainyl-CoA:carnitine CoA-transferase CaiB-like acyl-CoA transferase